jgi:hypothetical protein
MEPGTIVLRDIHGLDTIPWWPLATGWWYLIAVAGLLLLGVVIRYWMIYTGVWLGWRGDARRQLRELRKDLRRDDPREIAGRLSELLRRIAMARSGRKVAAGLTGGRWLQWLNEHDDSRFDWERHGQILLTAASRWVEVKDPAPRRESPVQWLKQQLNGRIGRSHV